MLNQPEVNTVIKSAPWKIGNSISLKGPQNVGYDHYVKMLGPKNQNLFINFGSIKQDPNDGTMIEETLRTADRTLEHIAEERKGLTNQDQAILDQIRKEGLLMVKNGTIKSMGEIHDHVYSKYGLSPKFITDTSVTMNHLRYELGYMLAEKLQTK